MALKVVAFDCDGVLFDSRAANIAFYNHILAHFRRPLMTEEQVDYVHAHTVYESIAHLFPDQSDLEEVTAFYRGMDAMQFIPMMVREPHLVEFLAWLKPQFGTAVATNRTTTTKRVFAYHELTQWFDVVICALDVAHPKPHPESFWKIRDHFRITPEEVIFFGDSSVDQEFAQNAGIRLVAYRNPQLQADYHLESFAQGPELIRALT